MINGKPHSVSLVFPHTYWKIQLRQAVTVEDSAHGWFRRLWAVLDLAAREMEGVTRGHPVSVVPVHLHTPPQRESHFPVLSRSSVAAYSSGVKHTCHSPGFALSEMLTLCATTFMRWLVELSIISTCSVRSLPPGRQVFCGEKPIN